MQSPEQIARGKIDRLLTDAGWVLQDRDGAAPARNQGLVLDVLRTERRAMTAYEILDMLRDHGLRAPAQVYRALESLMEREEGEPQRLRRLQSPPPRRPGGLRHLR